MNFKKGDIIELEIHDIAFGGKGISRVKTEDGEFVIFVINGIPGQTVKAKVMKKKKRFAEARKIKVIAPSADEVKVPFQPISGAPYITLPISKQQEYKKLTALDLFRKIGEIDNTEEL
ncbi:MAG: TRAM domain-containing protein, partial [Bacteroidetes bacterium]|nr:TRAM domain-containing protein [Bacteroidota bacterium]